MRSVSPAKLFRCLAALLAALLFALGLATPAAAMSGYDPDFTVTAEAAYVVNTDTNLVVYEKNSETPLQAASLTKLMTMILLLKNYQDQLDTISVEAPPTFTITFTAKAPPAPISAAARPTRCARCSMRWRSSPAMRRPISSPTTWAMAAGQLCGHDE